MTAETKSTLHTLVVFSGDTWEHVCPVVRLTGPAEQAGLEIIHGNEWEGNELRAYPERIQMGDVVIIQRDFPVHTSDYEAVISVARRLGKPVIYELDDLLTELPEDHPGSRRYLPTRLAILRALTDADAATGSTQPICEYLKKFNSNVYHLPNYLDDRYWKLRPLVSKTLGADFQTTSSTNQASNQIVIGYLGSPSHLPDFSLITPVLTRLILRYGRNLAFRFWGFVPPPLLRQNPNVQWTQVSMVSYRQFAEYFQEQNCDIVIAPLHENLFNRCKSSIKFLEYSALGLPGVYSRVEPYQGVIQHGKNGFLASQSPDEWEKSLIQLIEDESLRNNLGAAAQETVRRDWLLSEHAVEWKKVYDEVLQAKQRQQPASSVGAFFAPSGSIRQESDAIQVVDATVFADAPEATRASEIARLAQKWEAGLTNQVIDQEKTIQELNGQVSELNVLLAKKDQAYRTAYTLYLDIMNSTGWKVMLKLFRLREKILPIGSRRENIIRLGVFSLQVLRREGPVAFIRGTGRRINAAVRGNRTPSAASQFQLSAAPTPGITEVPFRRSEKNSLENGLKIPVPAISILTILDSGLLAKPVGMPLPDSQVPVEILVSEWIGQQTLGINSIETAVWDRIGKKAWLNNNPPEVPFRTEVPFRKDAWPAASVSQVMAALHGRYLCITSTDLLQQPPTFLEENLIPLETENLAFTVNISGFAPWAVKKIESGFLPGSPDLPPLFRLVVALNCIQNDFSLNLSRWFEGQSEFPSTVGKIITHTSREVDIEGILPFENQIPWVFYPHDVEWQISGPHILANLRSTGSLVPAGLSHQGISRVLHPVNSVLPDQPILSDRPTILLVQQFLAVGGAEQLALHIMQGLKDQIRFVVISTDPMDVSLGTLAEAFRQLTPYVYSLPDFLEPDLTLSFFEYAIDRFQPETLYIANGSVSIYAALRSIKRKYPNLRTINQVYDSQVGWINNYDIDLVTFLDAHIGANQRICEAYIEKGARPESVYQIEHAIDFSHLNPGEYSTIHKAEIRLRMGLSERTRCVTFASRLNQQKRPMDFIELARRFQPDPSVEFLMIGEGPLTKTIDDEISRIGLRNIRRHPFYRPISDILVITDVLVLPSEYEGMPLIVSETSGNGKARRGHRRRQQP